MLNIFRSNISLVMFAIPLVMVLTWLPNLSSGELRIQEYYSPILELCGSFYIPVWLSSVFNFSLVLVLSSLVNIHFNEQDYLDRQVFLPSLLFAIFWAWFGRHTDFSMALVAALVVIIYHGLLTRMRKGMPALKIVLESGLFLGVAILMYWPAIFFMSLSWIYLIIFRPFVWREWLISVLAVLIIPFNFFGFAYALGNYHPLELFTINELRMAPPEWPQTGWFIAGFVLIIVLVSAWYIFSKYRTSGLRFRKLILAAWVVIAVSILASSAVLFLTREIHFFVVVNAVMCIPVSWYLSKIKPNQVGDVMIYVLFALLVVDNLL